MFSQVYCDMMKSVSYIVYKNIYERSLESVKILQ